LGPIRRRPQNGWSAKEGEKGNYHGQSHTVSQVQRLPQFYALEMPKGGLEDT
jgi:hypothetical protein